MDSHTIVIGGGIAGITAAVELADAGKNVILLEKEPYLGGKVARLNNYFPKLCPPSCGLEINYRRIRSNSRVTYHTGAEVREITGNDGDFRVKVHLSARMVNKQCTACGKCAEVCPHDSAYIQSGLTFPMQYTIDPRTCMRESCGKCLEVCEYDAIQLDALASEMEFHAQRVIVSTGWEPYDAGLIDDFCYADEPDVVSNMEFETILSACAKEGKKLTRPSDGTVPESIAFVQCAGSRDIKHLPYCSAVCCAASVKHALTLAEAYPQMQTEIFYIDLRLPGRNEKLLNKAADAPSVKLTKGKVGRIERGPDGIMVEVEDILAGKKRYKSFHMVVLATGMVPATTLPHLAVNEAGFLEAIQQKGIFPASSCKRPMDVSASVKDATATALKSMRKDHE